MYPAVGKAGVEGTIAQALFCTGPRQRRWRMKRNKKRNNMENDEEMAYHIHSTEL
jgi:hypothetical protein